MLKSLIIILAVCLAPLAYAAPEGPGTPPVASVTPADSKGALPAADVPKATVEPPVAPVVVPTDTVSEEPTTPDQLLIQAKKILSDWRALGWVYGVIALIGFLILCLRLPVIDTFLENRKLKHLKPWLAAGLGLLSGYFSTWATGAGFAPSLMAGLLAGLSAVGTHQLFTGGNSAKV